MKTPPQALRVLLWHPEPQVCNAIAETLPEFVVVSVPDRHAALASVEQLRPNFVVASHDAARRLLKDMDRQGSEALPVFLCPLTNARAVSELADVAADGHLFHTLDASGDWNDVAQNLRRLLFMRDSARLSLSRPLEARFTLNRHELPATCVDIGNRGLALHLPVDETIEQFASGVGVSDVVVYSSDGSTLLTRPRATVRQVRFDTALGKPAFRVGLALDSADETADRGTVLADPVRVLAHLRRAARRKIPVTLTSSDGSRYFAAVAVPPEHSKAEQVVLRTPAGARFAPGEVLELSVDLEGEAFRGLTSALQVGPGILAIALPRSLIRIHRRNLLRFHPPPTTPFVISFQSPIDGTPILRPVLDIHVGGLSFPFDAGREVLPLGLRIQDIRLTLPSGEVVHCCAEVRDVRALPADHPGGNLMLRPYRCGLRLSGVPARMRTEIVDTTMRVRFPSFRSGTEVPFTEIWQLMSDAGQDFPEYPLEIGPHVAQLERVQDQLAKAEGELGRAYVALDEGRPKGFCAGLRAYSRTWLTQHLAVAHGYHRHEIVARDVGTLLMEWAESLEDIDYVRYVWRTDSRWPNRLFRWIARTMRNSALTRLNYSNYLLLKPSRAATTYEELAVREGTAADAAWLEHHLRSAGRLVEMRSDDLTERELNLSTLGGRLARHGLHRSRRLFVVDGEQEPLAIALVERSTAGLCWPELTNAFRVLPTRSDDPMTRGAVRALASRCADVYRAEGRRTVVALAADGNVADFTAVGFERYSRIGEWTFHRSLIRTWHNVFLSVFERVARRERDEPTLEEALP